MPDFNWLGIRSYKGSQANAFEELCCQLARSEVSTNTIFVRKGTPDAGVECFAILPDTFEWGWQAKFFTSSLTSSHWRQLDESVRTALKKHPRLTRYTICLPIDLADPRLETQTSALQQWNRHVRKWQGWAINEGMEVEFKLWNASELVARLTLEQHRGRVFFWFGQDLFSREWFQARFQEAQAAAGARYTPELHLNLPIAQGFEGLGRTQVFYDDIKSIYREIRNKFETLPSKGWKPEDLLLKLSLDIAIINLLQLLLKSEMPPSQKIPWDDIAQGLDESIAICQNLITQLSSQQSSSTTGTDISIDAFSHVRYDLAELRSALENVYDLLRSPSLHLTNTPVLLITGDAGKGKTHLLCDITSQRLERDLPTLLIMGQQLVGDADPWTQILNQLDLRNISADIFLGALESVAQAYDTKILILIDALNEGNGKRIWPPNLASFIEKVTRYPWLGLALTVRSTYVRTVIPTDVLPDLIKVEHEGFAQHEYEAMQTYFDHYGIALPSVPLLIPEFQTPLFLKLLCDALYAKRYSHLPTGLQGITAIFQFYVDAINEKLSGTEYLDVRPGRRIVWRAIRDLADVMAQRLQPWLFASEAERLLNSLLERQHYENSLYRHLLSEGILLEAHIEGEREEVVVFNYERFSDHFIVESLLKNIELDEIHSYSDIKGSALEMLLREDTIYQYSGWFEALAIQLPENGAKELPAIVPHLQKSPAIYNAFFQSLIWRGLNAFSESTDLLVEQYLGDKQVISFILDALLTVTSIPHHPYNADFLHDHLIEEEMAERDAKWSVFLHSSYSHRRSAIDQLIDWAWSSQSKETLDNEVIRLAGTALSWLFTSSNRFLRDRATKALVTLLTERLDILEQILEQFDSVNDLYVRERLYGVAYGCALRSTNVVALRALAQSVYDNIFALGTPPSHLLLRDYARGVIEYALHQNIPLAIKEKNIRPPYKSKWPKIPTTSMVRQLMVMYGGKEPLSPSSDGWATDRIHYSIFSDDFARYIIGTNGNSSHWLSLKRNKPRWQTMEEQCETLIASINSEIQEPLQRYRDLLKRLKYMYSPVTTIETTQKNQKRTLVSLAPAPSPQRHRKSLESVLAEMEISLRAALREEGLSDEEILMVLQADYSPDNTPRFDLSKAQRWILQRVFELGWTIERFGKFDRHVKSNDGRRPDKPERIGKKYQWIAYYEFLAYLADHFQFRDKYANPQRPGTREYQGPWQINVRDIDPSSILKSVRHDFHEDTWWLSSNHEDWATPKDDVEWICNHQALPKVEDLLQVQYHEDSTQWLALNGFYSWEQPLAPHLDRDSTPQRRVWYKIVSYLVSQSDLNILMEWAKEQNFEGGWMPHSSEIGLLEVYLGEFYWSQAYQFFTHPLSDSDYGWVGGEIHSRIPKPVLATTEKYMQERGTLDCSIEEEFILRLPTKLLVDGMNLHWNGQEGRFYDEHNTLLFFDSTVERGNSSILFARRNELQVFLTKHNLSLMWIISGERRSDDVSFNRNNWKGRLSLQGAYSFVNGQIQGVVNPVFHAPH